MRMRRNLDTGTSRLVGSGRVKRGVPRLTTRLNTRLFRGGGLDRLEPVLVDSQAGYLGLEGLAGDAQQGRRAGGA